MKTLTIPKRFGYPTLDITVNGIEYTVKSGEEITLEDHIAEAIENAIALAPKFGRSIGKLAQIAEGSLTELTYSDLDGIETIAYYAFGQCFLLTRVEIPNSITMIKNSAFLSCRNLKSVYLPNTPPSLANIGAFSDINTDCVFYCETQASLEAYKKAENWSTLAETYTFAVE